MNNEEYIGINSDIVLPEPQEMESAVSKVESFMIQMQSLASSITSFSTDGLDLGGVDYGIDSIKRSISNLVGGSSELNAVYDSMKQIVMQMYGMETFVEMFENDSQAILYRELLENVTQDDYLAYVDKCDSMLDEYTSRYQELSTSLNTRVNELTAYWDRGLVKGMRDAYIESDEEYQVLTNELKGVSQAIGFFKQFKEYYYVQAYNMYKNEADFGEMSTSRIDHYEEIVTFGLAPVSANVEAALTALHDNGYYDEKLPENYTEDDVWEMYDKVIRPGRGNETRYKVYFDKDGNEIKVTSLEVATYLYQTGQQDNHDLLYDRYVDGLGVKEYCDAFGHLTQDEINILQYLERTGQSDRFTSWNNYTLDLANRRYGNEKAQKVIEEIEEIYGRIGVVQVESRTQGEVTSVRTYNEADAYGDAWPLLVKEGFVDGLKRFVYGIDNLSNADGRVSPDEYKASYILGYLDSKYADDKFDKILSQATYEISSSVGNMAPSIAASWVIGGVGVNLMGIPTAAKAGKAAGLTLMGLSATGNAREEGLQMGLSDGGAWLYGALSGMSEVGLEYALGGMMKLSNGNLATALNNATGLPKFFASMLSEGTEESLQSILQPLFLTIASGGEIEYDVNWKEVAKSGIYGMITAGIMNGSIVVTDGALTFINDSILAEISSYIAEEIDLDQLANDATTNGLTIEEAVHQNMSKLQKTVAEYLNVSEVKLDTFFETPEQNSYFKDNPLVMGYSDRSDSSIHFNISKYDNSTISIKKALHTYIHEYIHSVTIYGNGIGTGFVIGKRGKGINEGMTELMARKVDDSGGSLSAGGGYTPLVWGVQMLTDSKHGIFGYNEFKYMYANPSVDYYRIATEISLRTNYNVDGLEVLARFDQMYYALINKSYTQELNSFYKYMHEVIAKANITR